MSYPKIYEVLPKDIILQIQDYIEGEVIYCYPSIDWRWQYIYIRVPPVNQNILLDFFCNHGAVRNMLS